MLKFVDKQIGKAKIPFTVSHEMAAKSTDILPAGAPILSTIFVVDKMDVIVCDGENNWYREADKPVASGQPISALF
jgi:hypothetical protein